MNTDRELMQQALEALSPWSGEDANHTEQYAAYHALRERLAQPEQIPPSVHSNTHQPEQKPVAWQVMVEDEAMKEFSIKDTAHDWCVHQKLSGSSYAYWIRPLYTTPTQRKPLTDEEIETYRYMIDWTAGWSYIEFARAIEAAHGITGEQHG